MIDYEKLTKLDRRIEELAKELGFKVTRVQVDDQARRDPEIAPEVTITLEQVS